MSSDCTDSYSKPYGMPPPKDTRIIGNTKCLTSNNFPCQPGYVGMHTQETVQTLLQTKDGLIGSNSYSTVSVNPNGGKISPTSDPKQNICYASVKNPITIDFDQYDSLLDAPITALHKTWGNKHGGQIINGGVHKDNISLSEKMEVELWNGEKTTQKCLNLELHGSNWEAGPLGIVAEPKKPHEALLCKKWKSLPDGKRVGACIATQQILGPGTYEVIAKAPPTSAKTGRGYTWAMWTFHYEEHYMKGDPQLVSQADTDNDGKWACFNQAECPPPQPTPQQKDCLNQCTTPSSIKYYEQEYPNKVKTRYEAIQACRNYCMKPHNDKENYVDFTTATGATGPTGPVKTKYKMYCGPDLPRPDCVTPPKQCDTGVTVVNHEIDIEIPGSWPGKLSTQNNQDVWKNNTMNCNTWIGDNEDWGDDKRPRGPQTNWYSQYVVQHPSRSFLSDDGKFHSYKFVWKVPKDGSAPSVTWYFDDQEVFTSYTYVPTRSGRLILGGWFPHWCQDGNSHDASSLKADFDKVNIYVAKINFTPDSSSVITDYPQNYDQCADVPIACDFVIPKSGPPEMDTRICNCIKPAGFPWSKIFISVGVGITLLLILAYYLRKKGYIGKSK